MMTWRRSTAVVLALVALAAAACGDDDSGSGSGTGTGTTDVTLMLNWTPNNHHAGVYLADQRGLFAKHGLDVDIVEPASAGVEAVVASGKVQFGIAQAESVLPAREQGVPVVSIATILPHNDSALMSLGSSGITRPRDLEGRTYGGYGGALETELISQLVRCDGGDPAKVKFVEVGNVDYLAGMAAKRFDVVWIFAGWDALRATTVDNTPVSLIKFIDHTRCIPDWYTPIFVTSESMIAKRPQVVRSFLAALSEGYQIAVSEPAAAADALTKAAPELDRRLVAASAAYYASRYIEPGARWGQQRPEVWSAFGAFAQQSGLLKNKVDPAKAFTTELLP